MIIILGLVCVVYNFSFPRTVSPFYVFVPITHFINFIIQVGLGWGWGEFR